ncbi:MAG: hypothetical protein J7M12_06205 [Candidatus Hydrogenedentes bacterium]|nr:hypothetical protein [Candidatus Hydrogenedentota bacterium]
MRLTSRRYALHLFAVVLLASVRYAVATDSDAGRVMAEWPLAHPDKVNPEKSLVLNDCKVAMVRANDLT